MHTTLYCTSMSILYCLFFYLCLLSDSVRARLMDSTKTVDPKMLWCHAVKLPMTLWSSGNFPGLIMDRNYGKKINVFINRFTNTEVVGCTPCLLWLPTSVQRNACFRRIDNLNQLFCVTIVIATQLFSLLWYYYMFVISGILCVFFSISIIFSSCFLLISCH